MARGLAPGQQTGLDAWAGPLDGGRIGMGAAGWTGSGAEVWSDGRGGEVQGVTGGMGGKEQGCDRGRGRGADVEMRLRAAVGEGELQIRRGELGANDANGASWAGDEEKGPRKGEGANEEEGEDDWIWGGMKRFPNGDRGVVHDRANLFTPMNAGKTHGAKRQSM